jgi:hypothetical protein
LHHRRDADRHALQAALRAEREHRVARVEVAEVEPPLEQQAVDRLEQGLALQPREVLAGREEHVGHLAALADGPHEGLAGVVALELHLGAVVEGVVDGDE